MRTIEVSAKTRELAIKDALSQLGVERDEVHVEILDEGSAGLFGFGARNVKLKVSTEIGAAEPARGRQQQERQPQRERQEPRRQQQEDRREPRRHDQAQRPQQQHQRPAHHQRPAQAPREDRAARPQRPAPEPRGEPVPRPPRPERKPAAPRVFNGPPDAEAEALVREVVERMGIEATITSATGENGTVSIKIESPDSAILIGRKGRSLESLQYLVNRMSPKVEGEEGERITVDIEGYLDRRQEALEDLAHRLADRARESGRRQRTKPMGSQERRVIHMALEGDETIKTFSVGDAGDRHVVIAPKDERQGGDDRPRGRGSRGDRGPRDRDDRSSSQQPRKPRGLFSEQPREPREQNDGDEQQRSEGNGEPRRRRRSRRGGRGRGPRPEAPAAQSETAESGSQES